MNVIPLTQHFRLALGLACALGLGAPALAQTTPGGVMAPLTSMAKTSATNAMQPALHRLSRADEFNSVAAAAEHCPHGTVVWSTLGRSKIYHTSSSRYFGHTKHGAYLCKAEAEAAGFRAAKK